jgi:hypothetical protein
VFNNLAAQLDKLLVGQRRLGSVNVLVQRLDVRDGVFASGAYRNDVVKRCRVGRQHSAG